MKNSNCTFLILLWLTVSFAGTAQSSKNRLQPGRMYEPGDTLYAPRLGFTAKVPVGWEGVLPRETETFLLMPTTPTYGEVYVFGREQGDLNSMRDAWLTGFDLTETIRIKATSPTVKDGVLSAEVIAVGEDINKGYKGFAISRCNPSGPCVTILMIAPVQFYDAVKSMAVQFMMSSSFSPPSTASPYADFDWKEFLSNKLLMSYTSVTEGSKENQIHLCADGTFYASVKKSGVFKNQNKAYRGSNSGKWSVTGRGPETTIQLTFNKKKLAPIDAPLTIKDEQVFSNDERYFVGLSDKCK